MPERVDLFDSTYGHFTDRVLGAIRKETFGTDIGQNSWLTVDEYDRFLSWLNLAADKHVLEVASGSGGPALYLARTMGCRVTGIDANERGVATASELAATSGVHGIVCSGAEVSAVRARFGDRLAPLVPGIRLAGGDTHDQSRVMTPAAAQRAGARYLVLGRAVTADADPAGAMDRVLAELRAAPLKTGS